MKGSTQQNALVKKESAILIGVAVLLIGFLGGIVFSAYKSPSTQNYPANGQQTASQSQQNIQAGAIPPDTAANILALEREVAANPGNVQAWIYLGNEYFDTNQPEKAIMAYTKSLELSPDDPNVLTDLGVMYRRAGKPQQALEVFDKAAQIDPKHEHARYNKGVVLIADLNDRDGAIKAWEEVLAINPLTMGPSGEPLKNIVERIKAGN